MAAKKLKNCPPVVSNENERSDIITNLISKGRKRGNQFQRLKGIASQWKRLVKPAKI